MRFFSNGEEIAAEALHEKDLLEAKIIGNQIYVITVKQGHGYIKSNYVIKVDDDTLRLLGVKI